MTRRAVHARRLLGVLTLLFVAWLVFTGLVAALRAVGFQGLIAACTLYLVWRWTA